MKIIMLSSGTGGGEMFNILYKHLKYELDLDVQNITLTHTALAVNPDSTYIININEILQMDFDAVIYETSNTCAKRDVILKMTDKLTISIMDVFDRDNSRFRKYVPDIICSPTETISREIRLLGYDNVITYTNPAFITIKDRYTKERIPKTIIKVLYLSQGREYYDSLDQFLIKLKETDLKYTLEIKLHPEEEFPNKELIYKWEGILGIKLKIVKQVDVSLEQYLLEYDLIAGYHSTLQIKSIVMGIPTIICEKPDYNILDTIKGEGEVSEYGYKDFRLCTCENNFIEKTNMLVDMIKTKLGRDY